MDEQTLIGRLRQRDEAAFRELVLVHSAHVIRLAMGIIGNQQDAEDVAQEVFISVFKTIDTFREEARLSTWLYRVTVNHAKNRVKYLSRRHAFAHDELDETKHSDNGPVSSRPDRVHEQAELGTVLRALLDELDEDHRTVVILRDMEELSLEEISAITGLPDGTIKSRLHRARQALRKKLERKTGYER